MNGTSATSAGPASEWSVGWRPLTAAFFAMASGWNFATMVAGVFLKPMQADWGWTRTELSFAPMAGLIMAAMLPVTGMLLDRFGPRRVAITGITAMTVALLLFALVPANRILFYAAAVFLGLSASISNSVVLARGVTPWFERNLGAAIGLMMTGASAAAAVLVPLLSWIVADFGWRTGFVALSAITFLLGFLPALIWFREPDHAHGAAEALRDSRDPICRILRTLAFWQVALGSAIAAIPIGGFLAHLIPIFVEFGFTMQSAAIFGSIFAIAIGFGRIANGVALDRLHPPLVTMATLCLAAAGVVILYLAGGGAAVAVLGLGVALIGLAQGAEGDYITFFSMRLFGLANFNRVVALMAMTISAGMALGGLLFSRLFDLYGGYSVAILASIALYAGGGLIFLTIRMRNPLSHEAPPLRHASAASTSLSPSR